MNRNRSQFKVLMLIVGVLILLTSCGTQKMMLNVKRPAEINLKGFKKIAMGTIAGDKVSHAADLSDGITTKLVESNAFEAVLDRQNLKAIMEEHKLNASGLVDANSTAELGKFLGSAALVFGRIQTDVYKEEIHRGDPYKDSKGKTHQTISRNGKYDMTANISVVDIQSSKILGMKTLPATYTLSTSADNQTPEAIDTEKLYAACLNSLTSSFMTLVAPYTVTVTATFQTDDLLPELKSALAQFKIGETVEAIKILDEASKKTFPKPEIQAKAFYNLGLAQLYSGLYDEATTNVKKAYTINAEEELYLNALNRIKEEKAQAEKLKAQQ